MIKCEKGHVEIVGFGLEVLSELSRLVHDLHFEVFVENGGLSTEASRKAILDAVEKGFKTDEELETEAASKKKRLVEVLDMLKEILTGKDEE